jgi:DHA1 family bicyclomycin/chloramphenicol resistance-like MFS transporter
MGLFRSVRRSGFRRRSQQDDRPPWIAALVLVTGVGPLATDAYLPAMPQVRQTLGTTASLTQLTMTAFIIGSAAGMLLLGPVSDGLGRRKVILAAAATFAASSLVCAISPSIGILIVVRFVQGVAAGGGAAVGLAVVSDRYEGSAAARTLGTLISINLLAPVIAPVIGAGILTFGDWRTVFAFLIAAGVLMTVAARAGIPETLPPARRQPGGLRSAIERMGNLLGDRAFVVPVFVQCLATAGFFTYIGGSSFVLQTQLGISEQLYALVFATNAAAMTMASICFRFSVTRAGPFLLRGIGLGTSTAAAAALAAFAVIDPHPGLAPVWCLLILIVGGMGLMMSATTAIAQEAGRRFAGSASALRGGMTFLVGALTTPLTGLIGHQTVSVMATAMAVFFLAATVLWLRYPTTSFSNMTTGRTRHHDEHR